MGVYHVYSDYSATRKRGGYGYVVVDYDARKLETYGSGQCPLHNTYNGELLAGIEGLLKVEPAAAALVVWHVDNQCVTYIDPSRKRRRLRTTRKLIARFQAAKDRLGPGVDVRIVWHQQARRNVFHRVCHELARAAAGIDASRKLAYWLLETANVENQPVPGAADFSENQAAPNTVFLGD